MTTVRERAEMLIMLAGSKAKALEIVREELAGRGALRAELKRLRAENETAYKKTRDYDERRESAGYQLALEHINEFLDGKPFKGWS